MEEPVDLQKHSGGQRCDVNDGHVKLKEGEIEQTPKRNPLEENQMTSADGVAPTEKSKMDSLDSSEHSLDNRTPSPSDEMTLAERAVISTIPSGSNLTNSMERSLESPPDPLLITGAGLGDNYPLLTSSHLVESPENHQNLSPANHSTVEVVAAGSNFAGELPDNEKKMSEVLKNSKGSDGDVGSSSSTSPKPLGEQHDGHHQPPAMTQARSSVGDPQGRPLRPDAASAELVNANADPVSTRPMTLLKSAAAGPALPCGDFDDTEFEDDQKYSSEEGLPNMELGGNATEELAMITGSAALVNRETRFGITERTYAAGNSVPMLENLSNSNPGITSREEGAVGGGGEFHDMQLKPLKIPDPCVHVPRGDRVVETLDQPEKLLIECDVEPGLPDYNHEIGNKLQDQEQNECPVCRDNPVDSVFCPCGHFVCHECDSRMRATNPPRYLRCHLCRTLVYETISF